MIDFRDAISLKMAFRAFWLVLSLSILLQYCSSSPSQNTVNLGYATYLGTQNAPGVVTYYGVPYAEPPVGSLRFRATKPLNTSRVAASTGGKVVDATSPPEFCIQGTTENGDAGGAGSEDCLKVNIYTPQGAKEGDNLPVLIYIHGGDFLYGNPANWPFNAWVSQSPNLIVVSVYYRLDSFGFLSHPEMPVSDLNQGTQDQIQALRWVQDYIGKFGGDKNKVTISGQSAGGASVEILLTLDNKHGDGLYNAAIAQSVSRRPLPLPSQQVGLFDYYTSFAGCNQSNFEGAFSCLQNASVNALARAQDSAFYHFTGPYFFFHPVVDGQIIRDYPTKLVVENKFHRVPLLIGATSNETLSSYSVNVSISKILSAYYPALPNSSITSIEALYPDSLYEGENGALRQFEDATGDSELRCARTIIASALVKAGKKAYTYRYNQPVPTGNTTVVWHSAENWMMFNGTSTGYNGTTTFQPQSPTDIAFAQELIAYWTSFARTLGDPNAYKLDKSVSWPVYTIGSRERVVLQEPTGGAASGIYVEKETDLEVERCEILTQTGEVEGEQA